MFRFIPCVIKLLSTNGKNEEEKTETKTTEKDIHPGFLKLYLLVKDLLENKNNEIIETAEFIKMIPFFVPVLQSQKEEQEIWDKILEDILDKDIINWQLVKQALMVKFSLDYTLKKDIDVITIQYITHNCAAVRQEIVEGFSRGNSVDGFALKVKTKALEILKKPIQTGALISLMKILDNLELKKDKAIQEALAKKIQGNKFFEKKE